MAEVTIRQSTKNASQSGRGCLHGWQVIFKVPPQGFLDPLMKWASQRETCQELTLLFDDLEGAVTYAKAHNLKYMVQHDPAAAPLKPHAYADHLLQPHLR